MVTLTAPSNHISLQIKWLTVHRHDECPDLQRCSQQQLTLCWDAEIFAQLTQRDHILRMSQLVEEA